MKVWKDKSGRWITFKEFRTRFAQGVEGITPLQQTTTILWSFVPVIAGMVWGIVVGILIKQWWLVLILSGGLPITTIQIINNYQKYKIQKKVEDTMKELKND